MTVTIHNSAESAAAYANTLGWTGCQFHATPYSTAGEAVLACHADAAASIELIRTQAAAHAGRSISLHAGSHSAGLFLCWPLPSGQVALEYWS